MVEFISNNDFVLSHAEQISKWIEDVIRNEDCSLGEVLYVFCDDDYLHQINLEFLQHDTYTDIITFDNSLGSQIHGEIYISIQRVRENASTYNTSFSNELYRVMIHGILHLCGYKDKSTVEIQQMRKKEDESLSKINSLLS